METIIYIEFVNSLHYPNYILLPYYAVFYGLRLFNDLFH
jgi:hypothetical protein